MNEFIEGNMNLYFFVGVISTILVFFYVNDWRHKTLNIFIISEQKGKKHILFAGKYMLINITFFSFMAIFQTAYSGNW